jgi:hypothetical protein
MRWLAGPARQEIRKIFFDLGLSSGIHEFVLIKCGQGQTV